jgi:nicotinate-nucleotide pyrophosphorylase (carboxylating)
MYHELPGLWKDLLQTGLKEDGWPWDWTTLGTRKNQTQKLKARVIGKSEGIWAAESLVSALRTFDSDILTQSLLADGEKFKFGHRLVTFKGPASTLLALERPFLNLAAYACGIATATAQIVKQVQAACPKNTPRVTLTRKTLPGFRDICIHSVRVGGGFPHRVGLGSGVLIKENHIAAAGSILKAVQGVRAIAPHGLKIEVEVRNDQELREAIKAEAEGVLLDNFSPDEVRAAVKFLKAQKQSPWIEVSGGLSEMNISKYAIDGVSVLSLGALTHSVQASDLSFLVDET